MLVRQERIVMPVLIVSVWAPALPVAEIVPPEVSRSEPPTERV